MGGTSLTNSVSTIMKAMIRDSVAQNLSLRGAKGKINFASLKISVVLQGKHI